MSDKNPSRSHGLPADMAPDDVKALFSMPDDDDSMHAQPAPDHSADTGNMVRADTLRALAERVEAGESARSVLGIACGRLALTDQQRAAIGRFVDAGAYLDAVAALQEAVLPGWRVARLWQRRDGKFEFALEKRSSEFAAGEAPTEPAARLAACLRALAMEAERAPQGDLR